MNNKWRTSSLVVSLVVAAFVFLLFPTPGYAIPAFSRQYGTSCTTCHLDFPKLNDFGTAFKDAGFKFPKDDDSFLKVPPTMLVPNEIRVIKNFVNCDLYHPDNEKKGAAAY